MHPGRKTETNELAYAELCLAAWSYLMQDWALLVDEAKAIAEDIFKAMNKVREEQAKKHAHLEAVMNSVLKSPSFSIGNFLTRFFKFRK